MSRHASTGSMKSRPSAVSTKSFTRFEPEPSTSPLGRSRASTIQAVPSSKSPRKPSFGHEDVFEKPIDEENEAPSPDLGRSQTLPDRFDELPIELASLVDRFVESLGARIYNEPPSVDQLSELFQEFYIRASGPISIHISTLKSRLNRESSPSRSKLAARSRALQSTAHGDSLAPPTRSSQQMLTASEVTEKRKQRKLLEYKRILLEEAVERIACEKVYDKLWRHKSTLDEVRDEKLRSKTAALSLVGIGLKDLGIEWNADTEKSAEDVQASLLPATEGLAKMNDEHHPLGKLQHLTAAHKAIVDTLSSIHPSSSSADEILPTLIYTLIISPVEGINVISNLYFIQRFRAASRIDGEAAYCLTNLEAAISFLENVDLASLRADELPEGPPKAPSQTDAETPPKLEAFPPLAGTAPTPSTPTTAMTMSNATGAHVESSPAGSIIKPLPEKPTYAPTNRHQRTLSDVLQPISNANEALRSTAEEGFKNISSTLDNSFKFLMGKLKERGNEDASAEIVVPRTLDEARQLVNRPLTPNEDDPALSESSSLHDGQHIGMPSSLSKTEDKLLGLFGGRKAPVRERSVDSTTSNTSGKRSGLGAATTGSPPDGSLPSPKKYTASAAQSTSNNPLESVKNFGTSLNPINHIGSALGAFGRFGGRVTTSASPPAVSPTPSIVVDNRSATGNAAQQSESKDNVATATLRTPDNEELASIRAAPPIARFMSLTEANELKIGDVQDLLSDYQRLAKILGKLLQRADDQTDTVDAETEVEGFTSAASPENS
ncbi:hypothetical protein LTR10_022476 [Elasticomyces elasticus]|uniref:VPS9 domain-containing protein n=1 Tax=Exophiala sideris TaxID=1016849 RepID=A0ABR0J1L7_9EURO|nr:hypothetical protein LTR10_022476 [Elasticomyces elasticus]KAK5024384.1 hypothetical protein LTS07_008675 [Exophiala sideris]KAK5030934.1 hypothetical protein LTR13_007947 [Exophiala sideris]KAK5054117.1 hypothetical protein LTR69_009079 [Exophiala sideris]KAK5179527.1 hypothetical protein LTR44_008043 [Eurotiomycetes sp. CCFEE 6388]